MQAEVQKQALKDINSELLPTLNMYGYYAGAGTAGPKNPNCSLGAECVSDLPTGFASMFANTFNYSSPEYQVGMTLSINLRNRQAKADQFRAVLQYRQSQISSEQQQKGIRLDVRNSKFALEQAQACLLYTSSMRPSPNSSRRTKTQSVGFTLWASRGHLQTRASSV